MSTIAQRLGLVPAVVAVAAAWGQVYPATPDWVSAEPRYGTGAALVDLNLDGWVDLVIANGNDMRQERLSVYYNNGDGTLPTTADWESADSAFNGHLDVADVNGDGYPDVAVAVLGNGSQYGPAAKLYLNNAGTLSSSPSWISSETMPAFGCSFGDMNGDGKPDLAVATGWAYGTPHLFKNLVYVNTGSGLPASATWQSADSWDTQGAIWVDADDDGWLDLAMAASATYSRIYRNLGGVLETTATWTNESTAQDAIMLAAGDVTGDGRRDLFITDNTQLGGSGRFRQYNGLPQGGFSQTYNWSYFDGYGSALALCDVDADGDLDLATGAWWDYTRLFLNTGAGFGSGDSWRSTGTTVVEKIVFADVNRDGLRTVTETFADPTRSMYSLAHQPVQRVAAVTRDGVPLGPGEYTFSYQDGWISVGAAPVTGLAITYQYSQRPDMAVSNWDTQNGNQLYLNRLGPICLADFNTDGSVNTLDVLAFLNAWSGGDPAADCNADGAINTVDVLCFLNLWSTGC